MDTRMLCPSKGTLVALTTGAVLAFSALPAPAQDQTPITVVINQSPWLDGFAGIVEKYEDETGNQVTLDVNPYAGSLEKQRNAVRSDRSEYDLLIVDGVYFPEMYHGGFLEPLNNIDPDFELHPQIYSYGGTPWFDSDTMTVNQETGDLMTVPVNPNITLMFYRKDLYEENGLEVPTTWAQLLENAKVLHNPPEIYGITQRAARAATSITWDYWPYLRGHGGSLFADEANGDFTVTINSPEALAALETYIELANEVGPENTPSLVQSDLIQYLVTGRTAHAMLPAAAHSQVDDPTKSIVVDKVGFMTPPGTEGHDSAPALGHWLGGIPRNIPDENQQAALAFLDWFQQPENQIAYAELGGAPVSAAAYESDFAELPENRYMVTMRDAAPKAQRLWTIPEGAEIVSFFELNLNLAVAGEISPVEALNNIAAEVHAIVEEAGYQTGTQPDLVE